MAPICDHCQYWTGIWFEEDSGERMATCEIHQRWTVHDDICDCFAAVPPRPPEWDDFSKLGSIEVRKRT
jgi:hypothetical protein